jgi:Tol biopolymer transport system component
LAVLLGIVVYLLRSMDEAPAPHIQGTVTQLTSQADIEYLPSLSPDGQFFVYRARASGNMDIYLQRVGGENPINLTADCPEDDT